MHVSSSAAATVPSSLVDLLAMRASEHPDRLLYRFFDEAGSEHAWTYADLQRAALRIAAGLEELGVEGEPVLLLYPPGLEYIAAFFGCLVAGAIAVPAYPPRPGRTLRRLETILTDCGARVALTTGDTQAKLRVDIEGSPLLNRLQWCHSDSLPAATPTATRSRAQSPDNIAFLQYTSGSTGDPKGVMVTHGNLLHNMQTISEAFDARESCISLSWLPMYHDMGLIGGILEVLHGAGQAVLFSPVHFLRRPRAWLEAVSKYKITHTGGPNFAYDLCAERIAPDDLAGLDLSSWQVAYCGAEPVRSQSFARFAAAFAPAGFRAQAFYPCYGLAESTLMVTSRTGATPLVQIDVEQRALNEGRAVPGPKALDTLSLVGSGSAVGGQRVLIVDPDTRQVCPAGRIGEIWIQGPSVARGYWNRPAETDATFAAQLADGDKGRFLRSGDLGFLHQDQLFVTGRIKDLIIVRGRKHFPQDLELTAQNSHAALQPAGGAAFGVDMQGQERIVLLHEVRREALRGLDAASVISTICQAVVQEHEARLDVVALLRPGALSRTTSGKLERYACRARFLDETLETIDVWHSPAAGSPAPATNHEAPTSATLDAPAPPAVTMASAATWLSTWLARRLELGSTPVDMQRSLAHYGLDSLMAVELLHDIERQFGRVIDVGTLVDTPSIQALASHLAPRTAEPTAELGTSDHADAPLAGVVRPTWRGPFGDRADGILVRGESPMRAIMPYLMRSRNESVVYHEVEYDLTRTLPWLDEFNRRHPQRRATLFDLFLWAAAQVAHQRPGINRFVSGRRIYQRRAVDVSFAAKKQFDAAAPLATIKLHFAAPNEPFADCIARIDLSVAEACHGKPRPVDRETALVMRLPRWLLRLALCGYRVLDHCNLLPGAATKNDPLYATLFVANLGSIGLDSTYHHLYEHGTCSLFAALGLPKRTVVATANGGLETRNSWPVRWTLDERIADGFYSAGCMRLLKSMLENPAQFVPAPGTE